MRGLGMKDIWERIKPSKRKLVQLYAALLYNAYLKGFIKGEIYTGKQNMPVFRALTVIPVRGPLAHVL